MSRLPRRAHSLRTKLLLLIIPLLALGAITVALLAYRDAHHEIDEIFDAELAQTARMIGQHFGRPGHFRTDDAENFFGIRAPKDDDREHEHDRKHEYKRKHEKAFPLVHKYEQQIIFQVHGSDGGLIVRSSQEVPETPILGSATGYESIQLSGHEWRVFSFVDPETGVHVTTAQRERIRNELSRKIARHLAWPMIGFLPLAGLIVAFGVRRGLKPLDRLAGEVATRTSANLTMVNTEDAPKEARPLVNSINLLLSRLARAFENERRFTSDASHELRTPLAGLKAHLQLAREASNTSDREDAINKCIQSVDRMTHLTSQLLNLARLDQQHEMKAMETVDLRAIASTVTADYANMAAQKSIELSLDEGHASIHCQPALIGVLIRNLIDNAIRYTPNGGSVRVSIQDLGGEAILKVEDSGPGIATQDRERIFERFYRGTGVKASGSGLGLSIVKRIAELHGANLKLEASQGSTGLVVEVHFPANAPLRA